MAPEPAFVPALSATAFTGNAVAPSLTRAQPRAPAKAMPPRRVVRMADEAPKKEPRFRNPFAKQPENPNPEPTSAFMAPQAGDPGYVPLPPVPKGFGMTKTEAPAAATDTKVAPKGAVGRAQTAATSVKRGLDLLREDLLKSAPERVGVGRQDSEALTIKPRAGEPGFKPQSFEVVRVSELGISPFPDDKNAVGKVGGIDAVKAAAVQVRKGEKDAKTIKKELINLNNNVKEKVVAKTFDIPDYLKPLPEDTPRKGMTWKNYSGR